MVSETEVVDSAMSEELDGLRPDKLAIDRLKVDDIEDSLPKVLDFGRGRLLCLGCVRVGEFVPSRRRALDGMF